MDYFSDKVEPKTTNTKDDMFRNRFNEAMNDDFNTPKALSVLFDLAHTINKLYINNELVATNAFKQTLKELANILGILQHEPTQFLRFGILPNNETIEKLIKERELARKNKNWQEADQIRAKLVQLGVELKDSPTKTSWKKL